MRSEDGRGGTDWDRPLQVVWLATGGCNARCRHCSSAAQTPSAHELTTSEAAEMLESLADSGVLDVGFSGGEPLMRDDVFELLGHASSLDLRCGLGSNGALITEATAARLAQASLDRLQISIDGPSTVHDRIRKWPGLYSMARRAIEVAIARGLRVHVCFTVQRENVNDLSDMFDACVRWGVRRLNVSRFVPTGRGDPASDLSPRHWQEVAATIESKRREYDGQLEVTTHLAQQFSASRPSGNHASFRGCQAGCGQGCIGPEGDVWPCVLLPLSVGNVRERPFAEVWKASPLIRALRDRSQLKGRCHGCKHRSVCGGCRAVAFAYEGDCLASDPRCWLDDDAICENGNRQEALAQVYGAGRA